MGTMTAPVGPTFLSVPLDVLVNRDLDKNGRDLLETLHKTSAATSTTASADMLLEPASKKQKLQSEPPVDSTDAALLRAGRKKPPWTPTEQAVVAIKHCELGNRWTQIAAYLPLRSENDVKNIWHSTLRCKDTQKRSFLRTYALAVHDHAYDYATRKAMFDIAVRQCGPPPPQASEMIARVQLLMDHPELQAAMQQQHMQLQEQQLLQQQHQQQHQDQLAQLTQLLQKRDELQQHQQLAHLAQLAHLQQQHPHLMLLQQQDGEGQDGEADMAQDDVDAATAAQLTKSASLLAQVKSGGEKPVLDPRRLLLQREKYGSGKFSDELYGDAYAADRAAAGVDDPLASELEQQAPQQRLHVTPLQGPSTIALRNQAAEPLDSLRANSDSGVSALRRYGPTVQGQGSSGGGAAPAAVAAATAAGEPAPGGAGAGPTASGGDAPPGASRQPGVQLPALGNLLALLYKYNVEQGAVKPVGATGWPAGGEEEEAGGAVEAPSDDGPSAPPATAPAAEGEEERENVNAGAAAGSQGAQALALRPLALRPLQPKRERELDMKADEEEAAAAAAAAQEGVERSADGSPKRPASGRIAARRAAQQQAAAAQAAMPSPSSASAGAVVAVGGAQPGTLRSRGSMPYCLQDADADERGAVEALALAARLNTSGGRTGPMGPSTGRSSASSLGNGAAAGNGNGSGGEGGRPSNGTGGSNGNATPAAGLRNAAAQGPRGGGSAAAAAGGGAGTPASGGAVLDLHARPQPQQQQQQPGPPAVASQPQPPPPARSLMRPSSDLHSPALQRQQQQQRSASQTLDVISVLNMPGLRRQVLSLPAQTLVALLCSPAFGSDAEASVLLLVALWLQHNKDKTTVEQARSVCSAVRLAALGGFYLSAVLPQLLTEPRVGGGGGGKSPIVGSAARPGGRWFEMRYEELAFLTRYVHAGTAERALLSDVARGVYDCNLPWYDMTPRYLGSPSEGFCFEWHIPEQGLRDALNTGTQPHAAFTVNDDISETDGGGPDGSVAVVPYILCRGLEWHVFVDCQLQRRGGAAAGGGGAAGGAVAGSSSVAGVFVYCRVPAALRSPGAGTGGFVGVVPGAGIRLGVHGWRCGRLEEVFVWTFGDETYFVPDAGMGCPSALPLRKRPSSPPNSSVGGRGGGAAAAADPSTTAWADYLHEGALRGTLTFLPH